MEFKKGDIVIYDGDKEGVFIVSVGETAILRVTKYVGPICVNGTIKRPLSEITKKPQL